MSVRSQIEISKDVVGPLYVNPETGHRDGLEQPSRDDLLMRGNQVSRRDDNAEDYRVGIHDIDSAILYYFTDVIRPLVTINGTQISVPVLYATPEKWQAVQKEGFYRDRDGKRQLPVILFKRDSLEKNRNITSKIDANSPHNFYVTGQTYTSRNQYDRFDLLHNRIPQKAYVATVVPDYVKITYSCIILTDLISQMNPLIEAINFASDSYWGPKDRFKFQAFVSSFKTDISNGQEEDRTIKTTFGITLNGYIIPESVNSNPYTSLKRYNKTHTSIKFTETVI